MIRILQCVNDMHRAGLETMLMNYYRNIDRTKIQFDFLTHRPLRSDYDDEIESLGGKMYYAPRLYPQNYLLYFKWMNAFFAIHPEYKIIHSHIDSMSYLPLLAGKKANIPIRIAHSHNTAIDKDLKYPIKQIFRTQITCVANHYLACGEEAGKFLFRNKNYKVIPNAIEASKFYFSNQIRKKKRSELGISDELVIGHIGRMSYQKNHEFLIDIFNEIQKKNSNSVLLLIGVGEKEIVIKRKIERLGLHNKVKFLGNRSDVAELYQAMDVFILPSFFEGIPVVGVEAQFANLPCIFSDKTPKEVKFNKKACFVSLKKTAVEWANIALQYKNYPRNFESKSLKDNIFDIKNAHGILENYYLELSLGGQFK